ncbi:D-inositol-3-phosphate glycosyltransferase [subsurface metagenome]
MKVVEPVHQRRMKSKVNLCHIQVLPILSGVQRSMLEIFKHFNRDIWKPHVICSEPGPLIKRLEEMEIDYFYAPHLRRPIRPDHDIRAAKELYTIFKSQRFHLVHTESAKGRFIGNLTARAANIPVIVQHVRGYSFHEFSPKWETTLFGLLERIAAKVCDRTIFVNEGSQRTSVKKGWLPANKTCTIYNGVDLNEFKLTRKEKMRAAFRKGWGLAPHEYCVTFIGRIWHQKNPMIFPHIVTSVRKRKPNLQFKLLVAGDGALETALRRQIREFGVDSNFKLLGWVDDNLSVYFGSDVIILPSLWEGLPRTLIEAQASGLPIIASNIEGNQEVVTPETGFICRPKEPEDYANAIIKLAKPDLRGAMGGAGRRRAEHLFDSAVNSQKIIELYKHLLTQKGVRI